MRIGILTSSRADFGIYLPLLKVMGNDDYFELKIIAFGTHLSGFYGETIKNIEESGFDVAYKIESMLLTDSANAIASSLGLTSLKFADFWNNYQSEFDLVFCLGDRYEMFAAVIASIPFQIKLAHLHGGETTLGAIDNIFRHGITLASTYHFVATPEYAARVAELRGSDIDIFHVGALSLDNLDELSLLTPNQFEEKWGIDLTRRTILTTFHPETVAVNKNRLYISELIGAINELKDYQVLITMPNADTLGNMIRQKLIDNFANSKHVFLIENLGSQSYFTALNYCSFLIGNTSSGIIEAASFGKYVINLGNRQKGRISGKNVLETEISKENIVRAVRTVEESETLTTENIYYNGGAAHSIAEIIKRLEFKR
ncbi:UDP-N-acetylglucosamine 2-epimerase [Pedobacter hartonius]|uniref:GDP/UDP-N,N'-diacetylbacillosamine 2-epimerase (Hydrolysing) n=1 Tax=Pedobacter hartonius TaxID=425514 RepID=A0A1H4FRG4_9SPHI|nr:UDP-N-acetylglucosamine 2-epimerase [Pedobacter hartonius]SEA99939.1 GDP/UDP-N,N'-diacetylbacillosamine 2-epimerase (hydrolysing) [Pedobacter hartonius]